LPEPLPQAIADRLDLYCRDVPAFASDVLGVERWDDQQLDVLASVPTCRWIAVKSGHAAGKTFIGSVISLWHWFTAFPCIVLTTAPTDRQVTHQLWREIRVLFDVARTRWPTLAEVLTKSVKHPNPEAIFMGFSSRKEADKFQGFHHKRRVFVVGDEASGVSPEIFLAITSITTGEDDGGCYLGNPSFDPSGDFYLAFSERANRFRRFTLDSEKSSWCSKRWIEERRAEWGEESILWRARVKGEFPREATDSLIPLAWIEAAHRLYEANFDTEHADYGKRPRQGAPAVLGVDVARFGSARTVFVILRDGVVEDVIEFAGQDLMRTVGEIVRLVKDGVVAARNVMIDDTGLGGGVTDRLHELGLSVVPVNFGSKPVEDGKFLNARSEIYWSVREAFRLKMLALPAHDSKMLRELCAPKYKMTSAGIIRLEPKDETIKRLGYSPDRSDALALAVWAMRFVESLPGSAAPGAAVQQDAAEPFVDRANFRTSVRTGDRHWGRHLRDRRS